MAKRKVTEAEAKARVSAVKKELAAFLHEQADASYREVSIEFDIPDGPMSEEEFDALIEGAAGLRALAATQDGRVRVYRALGALGVRLGRAAGTGGL